jgi:hypothetical protein
MSKKPLTGRSGGRPPGGRPTLKRWFTVAASVSTLVGAALASPYMGMLKELLSPSGEMRKVVCIRSGLWCPSRLWEIDAKAMPQVPHGLLSSMASEGFPIVMVTTVSNGMRKPLEVDLELKFLSDFLRAPGDPNRPLGTQRVAPGKPARLTFKEQFPFLRDRFDQPAEIRIQWVARNHEDAKDDRFSNVIVIRLLPTNTVDWDLRSVTDDPVSREFLVASLAAWTLSPPSAVAAKAKTWLDKLDGQDAALRTEKWFELAWDGLFHGAGALPVDLYPRPFPSSGQEVVRTPGEVLREPPANQLEAALLLATLKLAAALPDRLVLVAHGAPGQTASFLLAWESRGRWRALDMRHTALRFDENERAASSLMAPLAADPALLRALNGKGVFLDAARGLSALDFRKARDSFYIRALPSGAS